MKIISCRHIGMFIFVLCYVCGGSNIAFSNEKLDELLDIPLENLEDIKVSSVSKRLENRFEAAAATTVITSDDIRRSGATTIPDALRQVPGLEVAQIDANKFAISSRGFNRQFANKLLVLIDGRSVYTPLFAGTFWDEQDIILEDIDRIEVVRGPGAALWGSNAVNGVINIITKHSDATKGSFLSSTIGNQEKGTSSARFGAGDDDVSYRVYGKFRNTSSFKRLNGEDANDDWRAGSAGFRADIDLKDQKSLFVSANAYQGRENRDEFLPLAGVLNGAEKYEGLNLQTRWESNPSSYENTTVAVYFDHTERVLSNILDAEINTIDFDFQNRRQWSPRNDLTWGLGYRYFEDEIRSDAVNGQAYLDYDPDRTYNSLFSGFVQNKTELLPEKVYLTLGTKIEHNYFTGIENQPSARLSWLVSDRQTLWGSVAKAVRIPSRGERDISLVNSSVGNNLLRLQGSSDFDAETLIAYEIGYRIETSPTLSFDISTFYNDYDSLRSYEPNGTLNVPLANAAYGEAYGIEVASRWLINRQWNLYANYSYLEMQLHVDPSSTDTISQADEEASPNHRFNILSRYNISSDIEFDTSLYYVSRLSTGKIPAYTRLDMRLGWQVAPGLELSVVGQNLLDDQHQEFAPYLFSTPIEIPRSAYLEAKVRF